MSTISNGPPSTTRRRFQPSWEALALVGIVLVGAALRLYHLGAFGLWRDEAEAVFTAIGSFPAGILGTLRGDVHAPLYFLLLHFWEALLGRSEWAIRLLSALCGIATVPLVYLAGLRLWDRRVALLAGWVAAILPLHVVCSRTARMYSLLPLLGVLALLALYEALTSGRIVAWIAYALLGAATMYTHYWGALWIAALSAAALFHLAWQRRPRASWLRWSVAELGMGALFLPWLPTFLGQLRIQESVMGPWLPQQSAIANILRLFNELTALAWPRNLPFLWIALLGLGTVVVSTHLAAQDRVPTMEMSYPFSLGRNLSVLGLFLPMGVGSFLVARSQGLTPSYVTMAVFPALCLVLGAGLAALKHRPLIWLAVIGVSLLWLRTDLSFYQRPVSVLREVAHQVAREAQQGDVVIVAPDYLAPSFSYYYDGPAAQAAFPALYRRVTTMDWVGWAARRAQASQSVGDMLHYTVANRAEDGRVFLVAPIEAYPGDPFFDSMRALKGELDQAYVLEREHLEYRGYVEMADIFVYRAP